VVETKTGSAVIDVALVSMIVLVVRLKFKVVRVLSVGWIVVTVVSPDGSGWRIVCAPYVVVVMSVLFVIADVEIVGTRTEAERGKVVLNVVVVVASFS
jgi:hypothetical protein